MFKGNILCSLSGTTSTAVAFFLHDHGLDTYTAKGQERRTKAAVRLNFQKIEGERRAEIERIQAVSKSNLREMRQMQDERKQMQVQNNEINEIRAALVKAQGEKELEKLKAEKADDMLKKLEEILKDTQEQKLAKETRIAALENKIKLMYRDLPCDRKDCDMSCGKDHHCGTPTIKPRRRSRSRRGSESETVPTVANLATQAGTSVEKMQKLVDDQAARLPPKPPTRTQLDKNTGVELCRNFHYGQVCFRGVTCRYAHELVPANAMNKPQPQNPEGGRAFARAMNIVQKQPQPQNHSRPRARSTGRSYPLPAYNRAHPDYEWVMEQRARAGITDPYQQQQQNQVQEGAGNEQEQGREATSAPHSQPQSSAQLGARPKTSQLPRPRAVSMSVAPSSNSASSELEARRMIHQSLTQQSSTTAQVMALKDDKWKNTMDNVLSFVSKAYPSQAGEKNLSRNSSAGTTGSSRPTSQE